MNDYWSPRLGKLKSNDTERLRCCVSVESFRKRRKRKNNTVFHVNFGYQIQHDDIWDRFGNMNQTIVLTAFPANRHIEVLRWFSIVTPLWAAKLHFSGCVVLKTKIKCIDSNRLRIYIRIAATYIIIDSAMTTCKITAGNGKTFEVPVRLGALLISQNADLGEITHVLKHVHN